ncbi:MAG TPA: hypothetical protein VMF65_18370 [Acidimicrobiales bacterium]|nr:hypothetical protein [Acidimicrobiales bacterium]
MAPVAARRVSFTSAVVSVTDALSTETLRSARYYRVFEELVVPGNFFKVHRVVYGRTIDMRAFAL